MVDFHPTTIESTFIHGIRGTLDGTSISGHLRGETIASMAALHGLDIDFGAVFIGDHATGEVVLTNISGKTVTVSGFTGGGGGGTSDPFLRTSDCDGAVLAPQGTCVMEYTFTPLTAGTVTKGGNQGSSVRVLGTSFSPTLRGEGIAVWDVTPDTINFGEVPLGQTVYQEITVTNVSGLAQQMPPMSSRDFNTFIFTTLDCTMGVEFAAGESCTVTLRFTATSDGLSTTNWDSGLQIGNVAFPIQAQAVGFREPNIPDSWQMDPLALDFGEVTIGESATLTSTLTFVGDGVGIVFPKNMQLHEPFHVESDCEDYAEMTTGEFCTYTVTFTPNDDATFTEQRSFSVYGNTFELSLTGIGVAEEVDPVDPGEEQVDPVNPGEEPADPADSEKPVAAPPVREATQQAAQETLPRTGAESSLGMLGSALALFSLGGFLLMRMGRRSSTR